METRGSRRKRMRLEKLASTESVDRITNLPEPLVHEIISRLPIRASARLSVLSKKWLYFVKTLLLVFINFQLNEFRNGHGKILLSKVYEFSNRYLSIQNPHVLQKVRLSSHFTFHLDRCIDLSVRGKIRELDMSFGNNEKSFCEHCLLPEKFHRSKLLVTVLKLESCHIWRFKFDGFPALQILSLAYTHILDQTLSDMVFMCPNLKSLILECCWQLKNVNLSSSSLKRLVIRRCTDVKSVCMDLPLLCTLEYDNLDQAKKTDPWALNQITEFTTPKNVKLVNLEEVFISSMKMGTETLKQIFAIFPNLICLRMKGCFINYQPQAFPRTLTKLIMVDMHIPELIEGFLSSVELIFIPNGCQLPCCCNGGLLKMKSSQSHISYFQILDLLFISQCCTLISIELSSSTIHLKFANPANPEKITLKQTEVDDYVRDNLVMASFENFEGNIHEMKLLKFLLVKVKQLKTLVIRMKPGPSSDNSSGAYARRSLSYIPESCQLVRIR